jgi:hypothetical protein
VTKVNCSTSFILATRFPKTICGGKSTLLWICPWLRSELAPHYSPMGRPSIDPELMIRMLVVGMSLRSAPIGRSGYLVGVLDPTAVACAPVEPGVFEFGIDSHSAFRAAAQIPPRERWYLRG